MDKWIGSVVEPALLQEALRGLKVELSDLLHDARLCAVVAEDWHDDCLPCVVD